MPKWENFSIWRGKLPHWRADNVNYYVTFRHRRPLTELECLKLLRHLQRPDGRKWDLQICLVLPENTQLIFRVNEAPNGRPYELSDIVEKAKAKAGREVIKKSGERFPPFYEESFDRIVRDEAEYEEYFQAMLEAPVDLELVEEPDQWVGLWVPFSP